MHPDLHTDLDNLDSVENNLRHSAKGSLDAYDVITSLTRSKAVELGEETEKEMEKKVSGWMQAEKWIELHVICEGRRVVLLGRN